MILLRAGDFEVVVSEEAESYIPRVTGERLEYKVPMKINVRGIGIQEILVDSYCSGVMSGVNRQGIRLDCWWG
jgi:hypothetical protein